MLSVIPLPRRLLLSLYVVAGPQTLLGGGGGGANSLRLYIEIVYTVVFNHFSIGEQGSR